MVNSYLNLYVKARSILNRCLEMKRFGIAFFNSVCNLHNVWKPPHMPNENNNWKKLLSSNRDFYFLSKTWSLFSMWKFLPFKPGAFLVNVLPLKDILKETIMNAQTNARRKKTAASKRTTRLGLENKWLVK